VRDRLDQLIFADAIVQRTAKMGREFIRPIERDERRHGDQAAVALGQAGSLPNVAEEHVIGEISQLRANFIIIGPVAWSVSLPSKEKQRVSNCENRSRCDIADHPLGGGRFFGHRVTSPFLCIVLWAGTVDAVPKSDQFLNNSWDPVRLDPVLVGSVMVEAGHPTPQGRSAVTAIAVSPLDAGLLDAVVRLVRLLDTPAEARFLAPLVTREIVYRLLRGEQGGRLGQAAALGGSTHRIVEAVERLRHDFDRPLHIEEMAQELGMSVSGLHHHFKAVTAMSPLQFQKHLRLQEARRLMLGEDLDAASAGYRVGYDDASHFSREYKRLFGAPPMRDVERLREAVMEVASL
jgi:AraC-like DNA-binding protein